MTPTDASAPVAVDGALMARPDRWPELATSA